MSPCACGTPHVPMASITSAVARSTSRQTGCSSSTTGRRAAGSSFGEGTIVGLLRRAAAASGLPRSITRTGMRFSISSATVQGDLGAFARQERFTRERSYDRLPRHSNDHERLSNEIRDIREDFEAGVRFDEPLLAQRPDAWFTRHFESHDAKLHMRSARIPGEGFLRIPVESNWVGEISSRGRRRI
jgi:hypothetical protein